MDDLPLVTIVVPIRNEASNIAQCLTAILSQDYAPDKIEVLVADGMSEDGTREIVGSIAKEETRVRLIDNPERIVPTGLNRVIRMARGSVILRVDGHTVIAPDYVRKCIEALGATRADNVGGPMHAVGQTIVAQAIALATSSRFGVGSATFHYADKPAWVDTVYMGAYRRELFDRIGFFDEELVRNQDDEFNFRLIQAGGKIWLDPQIRSIYSSRATLRGLWRQYREYGFWKVRVIQKHARPASARHLVPGVFVLVLLASGILSVLTASPIWLALIALPYALVSIIVSIRISLHEGWKYAPFLPLAFATLHLAYGIGFIAGGLYFNLLKPSATIASRWGWTS